VFGVAENSRLSTIAILSFWGDLNFQGINISLAKNKFWGSIKPTRRTENRELAHLKRKRNYNQVVVGCAGRQYRDRRYSRLLLHHILSAFLEQTVLDTNAITALPQLPTTIFTNRLHSVHATHLAGMIMCHPFDGVVLSLTIQTKIYYRHFLIHEQGQSSRIVFTVVGGR